MIDSNYAVGRDGWRASVWPVWRAWILLNRCNSSGFTRTFWPKPTLRTARRMKDVRFEYNDSWMDAARDCVRVIGIPVSEARVAAAMAVR
jgi:hypothetical protein